MKRIHQESPGAVQATRFHRLKELERTNNSGLCVADLERDLISESGVVHEFTCPCWEDKKERKAFLARLNPYVSRRDPHHYFVDHLVIHVPVPFLRDGIELIDTPGLNDTERYRVVLTEEYVNDVDAILFLTSSGDAYSQSDKEFIIRQLRRKTIKHLRVVVTKCDATYENAKRDARNRDEDAPSFEQHLDLERQRVRTELDRTLEELLTATDVAEDSRDYFREQLADIPINFISSLYHTDGNSQQSGIDDLHDELIGTLRKSERVLNARNCMVNALERVCERTTRFLKARQDAADREFNAERVKAEVRRIKARLNQASVIFSRRIKNEVKLLDESNEKDAELRDAKLDLMLLRCDSVVETFCNSDVGLHWKTRRCKFWGSLYEIRQKVADTVFPHVELLLLRHVERFNDSVRRITGQIDAFQREVTKLELANHLDGELDPIVLSGTFGRCDGFTADVAHLVSAQKDAIVRHLHLFVSIEVSERLEQARKRVADIEGEGTTWMQNAEVRAFYRQLKEELRNSLDSHLRSQIDRFAQILLNRADSIDSEIKQELDLVIDDRLNAIESGLTKLNDQQKAALIETLRVTIADCNKIKKRIRPPADSKILEHAILAL
jgi:predicted GTPase